MENGFVKVSAVSPKVYPAQTQKNAQQIIEVIGREYSRGTQLLVLPELCVTGYSCGDLFFNTALLDNALAALKTIAQAVKKMLVFVGLPIALEGNLYNTAAALYNGEVLAFIPKTNLPNYNEFYEKRYFKPATANNLVYNFFGKQVPFGTKIIFSDTAQKDFTVCAEICADVWVASPPSVNHSKYANIIVNLSASNEILCKAEYRRLLVRSQSGRTLSAYVYASAGEGESTTDTVFGGHNIIAENGAVLTECGPFGANGISTEIDVQRISYERTKSRYAADLSDIAEYINIPFTSRQTPLELTRDIPALPFVPSSGDELKERAEFVLNVQAHALKTRLEKSGSRRVVLGLSGGLDSTLALFAALRATDKDNIIAVTMPGFGTSARTLRNAKALARATGVELKTVDIKKTSRGMLADIGHDTTPDTVYENVQARMRTAVLFNIANAVGGLVLGTGDLSEAALGWSTYGGDHLSSYSVNCGVPKTLIKHILAYEANKIGGALQMIVDSILNTDISPELLPTDKEGAIVQKTEEILGAYELHDFFLYRFLRCGDGRQRITALAEYAFKGKYGKKQIEDTLEIFFSRFFKNQFKRSCAPDGPKIGTVCLSVRTDLRLSSDIDGSEF